MAYLGSRDSAARVSMRVDGSAWGPSWLGIADGVLAAGAIVGSLVAIRWQPTYAAGSGFRVLVVQGLGLAAVGVPCGPVNSLDQVFADPQVRARGMRLDMPHDSAASGSVPLIANPLKMSATPPTYRHSPPTLGQHTDEVLHGLLGLGRAELARLREAGTIG